MNYKTINKCNVCGENLKELISLPKLPVTDIYYDEYIENNDLIIDQAFMFCPNCRHGQLKNFVSPKILYDSYSFVTKDSCSRKSNDWFSDYIYDIVGDDKFASIIDIGSNDNYLLGLHQSQADCLVGIDPMLDSGVDGKLVSVGKCVEEVDLDEYISDNSLVISSHFLEHIKDPRKLLQRLYDVSTHNTTFIFYFPCFDYLIKNCRFDQIYHHHYNYFSKQSIEYLLNDIGFEIIDYAINENYWGSIAITFKKGSNESHSFKSPNKRNIQYHHQLFLGAMGNLRYNISLYDNDIYAYGASYQLPVLLYHIGINNLNGIFDDNRTKSMLYYPNLDIQIEHFDYRNLKNANIIVTAPNFARDIICNLRDCNPLKIFIPFRNI